MRFAELRRMARSSVPTDLGFRKEERSKFHHLRSVKHGVSRHYRFRVQPVRVGMKRFYQLRVGMEGERTFEYIPVHLSAFAERISLEPAHETEAGVQLELTELLAWLDTRCAEGREQRSELPLGEAEAAG
jgi:hypothetical protein